MQPKKKKKGGGGGERVNHREGRKKGGGKDKKLEGKEQEGFKFNHKDNIKYKWGFPGGTVVGSLPASAGDTGSSPGLGGSHMPRSN